MRPTPAIDKHIAPLFTETVELPCSYTLDVDLLGSPIPVKRQVRIPSNMNLGYVQEILMLAMGWEGNHLKEISYGNVTYFTRYAGGQDPEPVEGFPQLDSFKFTLEDLLKEEGDSLLFKYDFGDGWKHRVTLTEVRPYTKEQIESEAYWADVISGINACPPEDVGGVNGYAETLKNIRTPEHEDFEDTLQWIGADFDPYDFSLRNARARVADFQRTIGEARWGFYHR